MALGLLSPRWALHKVAASHPVVAILAAWHRSLPPQCTAEGSGLPLSVARFVFIEVVFWLIALLSPPELAVDCFSKARRCEQRAAGSCMHRAELSPAGNHRQRAASWPAQSPADGN